MKILLFFIILFIISCANKKPVTFSYSSVFKINLPYKFISDGTVFYSDELSILTNKRAIFSGKIISCETENMQNNCDIREYPEYILGIKKIETNDQALKEKFSNSEKEIKTNYDLKNITIIKNDDQTLYNLCNIESCLAFLVKNNFDDHIFTAHTNGISQKEFIELLQGNSHAN